MDAAHLDEDAAPFAVGGTASPFDGGNMTDNAAILTAHAQYFVKFVQAYGQQGITIETVAPQNEPNYGENYPSCLWAASLFTKFVGQYLGRRFTTAGLTTKIMLGTMSNNGSSADAAIVTNVMGDATAKKYIKVLGYQWDMKDHVASRQLVRTTCRSGRPSTSAATIPGPAATRRPRPTTRPMASRAGG